MTRWNVGDRLLGEIDGPIPNDLEIRSSEGSYWYREGGTWTALTGPQPHLTSVSSERLYDADRPAIVTYVPSPPSPHTAPGHYVCGGTCSYRFELGADRHWYGPWNADGTPVNAKARPMTWWEIEENWGDCAQNLVGPVNPRALKGL